MKPPHSSAAPESEGSVLKIAAVAATVAALFRWHHPFISVAFKPNTFRVQRSTTIKARRKRLPSSTTSTPGALVALREAGSRDERTYGGEAGGKVKCVRLGEQRYRRRGRLETESSPNSRSTKL